MSTDKSQEPHSQKSLIKASSLLSVGILSSRLLGFVRDVVLANLLGTGVIAEAFFVAQRIPNLLRDLVGEGAANAAIVPVLVEYKKTKTKEEWKLFVNVLLAWGVIILGLLTVLGIILAPIIVRLMAPGFLSDPAKYHLTVDLTRIMFPYLILIALTALQMGILYTLNSFGAPAFSSCLLNVAMIISVWVAYFFSWASAYILATGVLAGGILQLIWQRRALAHLGLVWSWPAKLRHEGIVKIGKLLVPRLWGSAVYQMNIFVDTLCASLAFIVGSGGIAAIYFANRLIQFPLGVFAYSLSSASLPSLSSSASDKDYVTFKETLMFSLRNLLFILLPCAVYLYVLSPLLVRVIFQHGAFDQQSADITTMALEFLSLGLPFFGASRILVSGFYAMQDTQTSVRIATVCLLINIILNILLMFPLKIGGIALASSVSGLANFTMLFMMMKDRLGGTSGVLRKFFLRLTPSLIVMAAVIYLPLTYLSFHSKIGGLILISLAGWISFIVSCHVTGVPEFKPVWNLLKRKFQAYRKQN
ncbi:MAG: murein biosynthesis integral membrane protein MurJ [Candidatus Omnitrophica bacterium]|nr:murein biosynthesis integral membrane protein MurJ [Candidatus Omnitrophota bacterium]